jgi:hypothetical protein
MNNTETRVMNSLRRSVSAGGHERRLSSAISRELARYRFIHPIPGVSSDGITERRRKKKKKRKKKPMGINRNVAISPANCRCSSIADHI